MNGTDAVYPLAKHEKRRRSLNSSSIDQTRAMSTPHGLITGVTKGSSLLNQSSTEAQTSTMTIAAAVDG
jgi:hypothetical protein